MALIELFRTISERKYLELARLFIDRRGSGLLSGNEYLIDHIPFRKLKHLGGHAVRALYLCCGATDLFIETGEKELLDALNQLWTNLTQQQIYITGGVGSRYDGEAIGDPYELPNSRSYAETCAAIANVMWNWRMLQISGHAKYADLLEWALYNAVLPGISLDGQRYFYENPMRSNGEHQRSTWFECACCPPNICRTIAMFPGYIYSKSTNGVWINQYAASTVHIELSNKNAFSLQQQTNYPWDGNVHIEIISDVFSKDYKKTDNDYGFFSIFVRIPGWLDNSYAEVRVNGELLAHRSNAGSYLEIKRAWKFGDVIELDFPMEVKFKLAHPFVMENTDRIAVTRGPVVYCMESVDVPKIDLRSIYVDPTM